MYDKDLDFLKEIDVAVTICDKDFTIIYMNNKAKKTFEKYGDCLGKNLLNCHNDNSKKILKKMMELGEKNTYTILKEGIKKLIQQTPWYKDGEVAGLIEISIEIPLEMNHYIRE